MRGKLQPGSKPPEYLIETTRKHIEEDKVQQSIKKIVLKKVLSKILCKWKQDSVVSLFLYLDSVFKYKHKLVHNQSPV